MTSLRSVAALALAATVLAAPASPARGEDGEKLVEESCGQCHNAKQRPLSGYHLTREKWKEAIERMEGMGTEVPSGKKLDAVLDYLARAHGPDGAAPEKK